MTSFSQKLAWRAQVLTYDIVRGLMAPFSFGAISNFGGWLFRVIGPRTSKHKIVTTGLRLAFPNAEDAQIKKIAREQWDNTGRTFLEFPLLGRIKVFGPKSRVSVKGLEHLREAYDRGNGIVLVTGHFANWEIMAAVLAQCGVPVHITYRHINNPYFDARVVDQRKKYGIKLLVPKSGAKGAKQLLSSLKAGNGIALMNDQKFNEGISVPFFGTPAMTAQGPTRLALKSGAPIIPMSLTRDKSRFHMQVHAPLEFETNGERAKDIEAGVIAVTKFVEARVRETPAQWFWTHRRWDKSYYKK